MKNLKISMDKVTKVMKIINLCSDDIFTKIEPEKYRKVRDFLDEFEKEIKTKERQRVRKTNKVKIF